MTWPFYQFLSPNSGVAPPYAMTPNSGGSYPFSPPWAKPTGGTSLVPYQPNLPATAPAGGSVPATIPPRGNTLPVPFDPFNNGSYSPGKFTNTPQPGTGFTMQPQSTALVPSNGNLPAAPQASGGSQGFLRSLFKAAMGGGGLLTTGAGLLSSPQNDPAVAAQLRDQFARAGRADVAPPAGPAPSPPHVPFSQSNLGQIASRIGNDMVANANSEAGLPAPQGAAAIPGQATSLPPIPDLGTTPAYGSFPLPTAQSMGATAPAGIDPTALAGGGAPMPRPRPQAPASPWVNPDAANNFYSGPGGSSFGAGDPSQGPQGQNFNIGALSRFFS